MVSRATDINTGSGCSRARDPYMILSSSPIPDFPMDPGSIIDYPDCHGLKDSVALEHHHGLRWPRLQASAASGP